MPEHQIRSYQKVIGLSIIPLFWDYCQLRQ